MEKQNLNQIEEFIWEIPKSFRENMRMPARVFASEKLLKDILDDDSLNQLINVATLPGIEKYALAMPDIHEGYGFPVGGVAAMDEEKGVISPGGIGYDINCGVRVLKSSVGFSEAKERISDLASEIYKEVPSGVGRGGRFSLGNKELDRVLREGASYLLEGDYATAMDIKHCESGGRLELADSDLISKIAKDRGGDQLGTIGAGNHFVEIQKVDEIFDEQSAEDFGLFSDQITVMIHCGSRGLGHQVATDYIRTMLTSLKKYDLNLPDRELACAPFHSPEGQNYFKAMSAAANFAWANRQFITWEVRRAWKKIFGDSGLELIYDVAHNIAKLEEYNSRKLVIHRKGATRSFPGQPVLIPGSMGTASYILLGEKESLEKSFGSSCHGAGRRMSRTKAKKSVQGSILKKDLEKQGISVRAGSIAGLAEEAPIAYKDVEQVIEVVHQAGLASKVARLKPIGVIKG